MSSNSFREMVEKLNQMEATGAKKSVLTEKAKSAPISMGMPNEIYDAPKSISGILNENDHKKTEAATAAKKDEKKENPFNYEFTPEHDAIIKKNKEMDAAKGKAPAGSPQIKESVGDADEVTVRRLAELVSGEDEEELSNNIFILNRLLTTGPRSLNLLQRNIALDMFLKLIPVLRSSNVFNAESGEEEVMDQEVEHEEEKKHEGEHKSEKKEENKVEESDTDTSADEPEEKEEETLTEKKDNSKADPNGKYAAGGKSDFEAYDKKDGVKRTLGDFPGKSEKPKKKVKSKKQK